MSERSFDTLQGAMPRLAGFAWEANKQKQVCWGTPNGNLAEASVKTGGAWELTALNAVSNAPLASLADVTGYAWPKGNSKQVCYTTEANAHIHEIYVTFGGSWKHADLTQLAGAPPCVGWNMSGYAWNMGGTKQVAYVGANDHIYELYVGVGHSWQHADLREGYRRVMQLTRDMDEGRRKRLMRLGFSEPEAEELSALHTRNFM